MMTVFEIIIIVALSFLLAEAEIHDPMHIFCGSENCYEVLGLNKTAGLKEIKKVQLKLYRTQHFLSCLTENGRVGVSNFIINSAP